MSAVRPAEPRSSAERIEGALFDLLMGVMDSMSVWAAAAGDRERGLAWRTAVTDRMLREPRYVPYEQLVAAETARLGLTRAANDELYRRWSEMQPWPDAAVLATLAVPFGFVTNCSARLARLAAERSGCSPQFTLSAEEIGWYKPARQAYMAGCARLGTPPGRTLFVAGAPYDAEGARAAGLQATLVNRAAPESVSMDVRNVVSMHEAVRELAHGDPRW